MRWREMRFNINYYEEICKVMFHDGFNKKANHGLWKLKVKLSVDEWKEVANYFSYYTENDKNIKNMRYYGWATYQPVDVIKRLLELRLN
jgi:hypothetical protein